MDIAVIPNFNFFANNNNQMVSMNNSINRLS